MVNAHVGQSTKGSEIRTDNLMAFKMDAVIGDENKVGPAGMTYFSGVNVSRTAVGHPWTMGTEYNWVGESNIYFWSYAPASLGSNFSITSESPSGSETTLAFDYEVKGTPASQEDLILAYNCEKRNFDDSKTTITGGTSSETGTDVNDAYVNVHFYHALSEISFAVSTDDGTFDTDLVIESITLKNVSGAGSCVFTGPSKDSGFAWTPSTDDADYADFTITGLDTHNFTYLASSSTGDDNWAKGSYGAGKTLFTTKNLLFMIPQDHSSTSTEGLEEAHIIVTFHRISNNNDESVRVDLEDKWEPGKYYKYKIGALTVGTKILLDYSLSVNDWVDGSKDLSL